jgi:catechol 2,3-dioxygenase-like lactoylglutathione lyase family enzyme
MDPRITLITLGVADLARAVAFYRDGLGWVPSKASVEGDVAFFQLNGMVLALWSRADLARDAHLDDPGGWGGLAIAQNQVSREAVDEAVARALAAGATLLKAPIATDWGGYAGYIADPDGRPWEIAHNPFWPLGDDGSLTLPE